MYAKTLLFALVPAGMTTASFSQSKVRFGAKAGLNVASLTGDYPAMTDTKSKIGFHLGPIMEVPLEGSKFSLLTVLLVSVEGVKTVRKKMILRKASGLSTKSRRKMWRSPTSIFR